MNILWLGPIAVLLGGLLNLLEAYKRTEFFKKVKLEDKTGKIKMLKVTGIIFTLSGLLNIILSMFNTECLKYFTPISLCYAVFSIWYIFYDSNRHI